MNAPLPLRCPHTGHPLHVATEEELSQLNQFIEAHPSSLSSLKQVEGTAVTPPLGKAWINETGSHAYIDQDNLPILIPDAAIVMNTP